MLNLHPSRPTPSTIPTKTKTISPLPALYSSAGKDSLLMSSERTLSSSNIERSTPSQKQITKWQEVRHEMYKCQEELVSPVDTATSEDEEESDEECSTSSQQSYKDSVTSNSSISSVSTCTSEEGTPNGQAKSEGNLSFRNGLSHAHSVMAIESPTRAKKKLFGRNSSREEKSSSGSIKSKTKRQKSSDPGYWTLRPNKSKDKIQRGKRFSSIKPNKISRSVEAEISSPSPVVIESPETTSAKSLNRQPAIRSKRGTRISRDFSQPSSLTIPESSVSFEVHKVNVIFKTTVMEVPCRGIKKSILSFFEGEVHKVVGGYTAHVTTG